MRHFILINLALLFTIVASYGQKNHPDGSTKPIPQGIGLPNSKFNCLELDASKSGIAKNYSNPRCVIIQPGYSFTATAGQPLCIGVDRETGLLGQGLYHINSTHTYVPLLPGMTEGQIPHLPRNQVQTSVSYFDGLGRNIQEVLKQGAQNGFDLVQIIEYDKYGRQVKTYMPYVADQVNDGGYRIDGKREQFQFYQSTIGIPHTDYPFTQTNFEASPAGRVLETLAAGENQIGANRKTSQKMLTNTVNIKRVMAVYNTSTEEYTINNTSEHYTPGELMVAQVTNVSGKVSETYTNAIGQTILQRISVDNGGWLHTYFVYDQLGRQVATIYPQAYDLLNQSANWNFTDAIKNLMSWKYYDAKGRVVAKKDPGLDGKVSMVYDELNRLILVQNPKHKKNKQWIFTKINALDQVVMTGIYTDANDKSRATIQNELDTRTGDAANTVLHEKQNNDVNTYFYLNQTFPNNNIEVLVIKFYGNYGFLQGNPNTVNTEAYNLKYIQYTNGEVNNPVQNHTDLSSIPTGEKIRVLGTNQWLTTVSYYDDRGRVVQSAAQNHLDGIDRTTTEYDFAGNILTEYISHTNPSSSISKTVKKVNEYNPNYTLAKVTHSIDGQTPTTISEYAYNIKGQITQKKVGRKSGGQPLQTMDYSYNIEGALTKINDAGLSTQSVDNDLFGMELSYDYGFSNKSYEGIISGMKWKSSLDNKERAYGFHYDLNNRLTQADYIAKTSSQNWTSINKATLDATNELDNYSVSGISYDKNGNIQALQRKGIVNFDTNGDNVQDRTYGNIDNLTYTYRNNRLVAVEDNHHNKTTQDFKNGQVYQGDVNNTAHDEYLYDENGSLIADKNKGITSIIYNTLNLPQQIIFGDASNRIEYKYNSLGNRLGQKVYVDGSEVQNLSTDYVNGMVYRGGELQFIPTPEGRAINPSVLGYNQAAFVYEYYYTDHLSNIRMAFSDASNVPVKYVASLEDATEDYNQGYEYNQAVRSNEQANTTANPQSTHSAKLNATHPLGPWNSLKLGKGDVVTAKVYAKHIQSSSSNDGGTGLNLYVTNLGANGVNNAGEAGNNNNPLTLNLGLGINPNPSNTNTLPMASLRYIFYDGDGKFVAQGQQAISNASLNNWETLELSFEAPQNGTLQVFVSNESNTDVWFDEMEVNYQRKMIVQETHYYPFGLPIVGIGKKGNPEGKELYQGKEWQTDHELNLYDFHARQYDPVLGRFVGVDPKGQFASPYVAMGNNPVNAVDPDGQIAFLAVVGIYAAVNFTADALRGEINSVRDGLLSLGEGAIHGALSYFTGGKKVSFGLNFAQAASSHLQVPVPVDRFHSFSFGPSFFSGSHGIGMGFNVGFTATNGEFSVSQGISGGFTKDKVGLTGNKGSFNRTANAFMMASYNGKDFGVRLGQNSFDSGKTSQTTGLIGLQIRDLGILFEDEYPTGDLEDRWRTGALEISVKEYAIGANIITGHPGHREAMSKEPGYIHRDIEYYQPEENPYGVILADRKWKRYYSRKGAYSHMGGFFYVRFGGYRFGMDNENWRAAVQNKLHDWLHLPHFINQSIPTTIYFQNYQGKQYGLYSF
ncbi:MAG TPA: hypothetical protein DCS93_21115 [Microscillaceae bacterium]|nr:hypothetical protein [Microscillaceae bacterium]